MQALGAPPGAMATSSGTPGPAGVHTSPAPQPSSECRVSLPMRPPRCGPRPGFSPPPKMDSPATRGFEHGTAHFQRPAGERDSHPPGARGRRPPTSLSKQPRDGPGAGGGRTEGRGGGGGDTGDGGVGHRGRFSRVRSPATRHRKLHLNHRADELARETRARPAC